MYRSLMTMALLIGLAIGVSAQVATPAEHPAGTQVAAPAAHNGPKIEWLSWEQAVAKMEKQPRKIMVDVYTDWCGWCKRMDATTMEDPKIIKIINEKYYAVKMDGEGKKDITFRGRTYKFIAQGHRGYHELPAELLSGKMSYPTLVFLDEEYGIIQPLPGYQDVPTLEPILAYFGGGFYKTTPWENFQNDFKAGKVN